MKLKLPAYLAETFFELLVIKEKISGEIFLSLTGSVTALQKLWDTENQDFWNKVIFSEEELVKAFSRREPFPHLTARLAAKLAIFSLILPVSKNQLKLSQIKITGPDNHPPRAILPQEGQKQIELTGIKKIMISLTHDADLAGALVAIRKEDIT